MRKTAKVIVKKWLNRTCLEGTRDKEFLPQASYQVQYLEKAEGNILVGIQKMLIAKFWVSAPHPICISRVTNRNREICGFNL